MSKVMRSVKNVTKGYSHAQVKVREATSNDPWGPTGTQMSEIAQMTFSTSTEFYDIMDMLDKRLNDKGKNWRHVLKALKVLDYCLHEGSELVVTWARQSIYIIKTLREFQYIDEEGRDVGQNVRVAAKELTALILNDERLRAERSDRKSWKSRVMGLDSDFGPQYAEQSQRRQPRSERRAPAADEDDTEYRLAIEASKYQEEEDRKRRQNRSNGDNDDDLAKAIKLSQEEEERRRRELEDANAASLFDDDTPATSQPQHTGFNQGYQQGNAVDFWANPIDQQAAQIPQPTGYLGNAYTGYQQPQPTGWQPNYNTGFGVDAFAPMPTGNLLAQQQQQFLQPQQFGQQQHLQPSPALDLAVQPGSNNPWATNHLQQQSLQPTPTGSNNPFAQNRPQSARPATSSLTSLSPLPEQKTLSNFNQPQPQFGLQQQQQQQQQRLNYTAPQRELSEHERKLNALLASGDGMDTYGNTGDLRIPSQHTAPGTFVNSAGAGLGRLNPEATGNNPFLRQQFTGMPSITYGSQPQMNSNPFGAQQRPQQQGQAQDLIQF
ncbi:ENTH-domain-containing protein [Trichoderma reesei RUT C-30]|uniref:ENTH-domain-containing protein n=2 Tax=Hypocrea jecorina TaxID=51453 RepID=A0A024RWG9_HYPJR|nr:ENTH-domain-containing protein [Trichoderma reesei RUT C-30]